MYKDLGAPARRVSTELVRFNAPLSRVRVARNGDCVFVVVGLFGWRKHPLPRRKRLRQVRLLVSYGLSLP